MRNASAVLGLGHAIPKKSHEVFHETAISALAWTAFGAHVQFSPQKRLTQECQNSFGSLRSRVVRYIDMAIEAPCFDPQYVYYA